MFEPVCKTDILLESWNPRVILHVFENMEERLGCGEDSLIRWRHFLKIYFLSGLPLKDADEASVEPDCQFSLAEAYYEIFSLVDVIRERIRRGFIPMNWKDDFIEHLSEIMIFRLENEPRGNKDPFPDVVKSIGKFYRKV